MEFFYACNFSAVVRGFGCNKLGYSLTNNPTVAMEMLHGSCDQLHIIFDIHSQSVAHSFRLTRFVSHLICVCSLIAYLLSNFLMHEDFSYNYPNLWLPSKLSRLLIYTSSFLHIFE